MKNDTKFNMTGYTKLFGSIVDSTIWRESKETKIVWITMLAKANRDGIVESSLPGLADSSRVSIPECEEALKHLSSPDIYSRTKAHEGRRIQEVDGGWIILNHAKYRAKMNADERREYLARKQQEWREKHPKRMSTRRKQMSTLVNRGNASSTLSTHAEAEAEAKAVNTKSVCSRKPTLEEVKLQFSKIGLPMTEAEKFFNYYESNGWRVGKNPMKSWTSASVNWKRNFEERKYSPATTGANGNVAAIQNQTALTRIEDRIKYLRGQAPLTEAKLKTEWNELCAERRRLMAILGFKA